MSQDISGQGLTIILTASKTYPTGFPITQFADDGDPLDIPDIQIADTAMGLNGDLVRWNVANPIPMTISIIPGSLDDVNLAILAEANRVGRGKISAKDVISAVVVYPNGQTTTLSGGAITNAPTSDSVASAGRKKTKTYAFAFENKVGTLGIL